MTTPTTYLDQFMDKMYLVPNDVNRYLRLIRTLDKKAQTVQQSLNHLQQRFLNQLKQHKQSSSSLSSSNGTTNGSVKKNSHQLPSALKAEYEKILGKQKQMYGYYKEKHQVSQQLKAMVADFYQQLDVELRNKMKEKSDEERDAFNNRRKITPTSGKIPAEKSTGTGIGGKINSLTGSSSLGIYGQSTTSNLLTQQFSYDLKQQTYCYCGRASFGEMVMCENPFCQREWFHLDCIEEKNLPEKWYCQECQKQKDKTRNPHSRSFFVNKESGGEK